MEEYLNDPEAVPTIDEDNFVVIQTEKLGGNVLLQGPAQDLDFFVLISESQTRNRTLQGGVLVSAIFANSQGKNVPRISWNELGEMLDVVPIGWSTARSSYVRGRKSRMISSELWNFGETGFCPGNHSLDSFGALPEKGSSTYSILLQGGREIEISVGSANESSLVLEFVFKLPKYSYLGLGFGKQMTGSDVILAKQL